jgi:hypothetical protein
LETDAESALFTVLVYTQTVPRAIEEDRISNVATTPPQSEGGGPDAEDAEPAVLPPEGGGSDPVDPERAALP